MTPKPAAPKPEKDIEINVFMLYFEMFLIILGTLLLMLAVSALVSNWVCVCGSG